MLFVVALSGCESDNVPGLGPLTNSMYPINNAIDVSRNKSISIKFSEVMDSLTINTSTFIVMKENTLVEGTVTYSESTATFTPSAFLDAGTYYTVMITKGAQSRSGQPIEAAPVWNFTTGGSPFGIPTVDLRASGYFVALAITSIHNIATSHIIGDLGLYPANTSDITGFAMANSNEYTTSSQVTGKIYATDMAIPTSDNLNLAVNNMIFAYNETSERTSADFIQLYDGNIGDKTFTPGLYKWTSNVIAKSDVNLSGGESDVWIFQIDGNLTTNSKVNIILKDGAQAKNVFWQVGGKTLLGTFSHFEGVILSKDDIILQTAASIQGRAMSQAAIYFDTNDVNQTL